MTFGAADTDLLLLSDGGCCCSGADHVPGFENYFRHNYLGAARLGLKSGIVSYQSLDDLWAPSASIAEYVNSNSRLPSETITGLGVRSYIAANWNGSANGTALSSLFGIEDTGTVDVTGFKIYAINREFRDVVQSSSMAAAYPLEVSDNV